MTSHICNEWEHDTQILLVWYRWSWPKALGFVTSVIDHITCHTLLLVVAWRNCFPCQVISVTWGIFFPIQAVDLGEGTAPDKWQDRAQIGEQRAKHCPVVSCSLFNARRFINAPVRQYQWRRAGLCEIASFRRPLYRDKYCGARLGHPWRIYITLLLESCFLNQGWYGLQPNINMVYCVSMQCLA